MGKHLEDISHAHFLSLMYKLITRTEDSIDLSIGFDRDRERRRDKLADNRKIEGNYHVRIMLKDSLGFAEHQEKSTHGLGYKQTLTRNKDVAALQEAIAINWARFKIDHINWYVP